MRRNEASSEPRGERLSHARGNVPAPLLDLLLGVSRGQRGFRRRLRRHVRLVAQVRGAG